MKSSSLLSQLAHDAPVVQVMPLHIVKWMFFSGEPISADQALQIGFLNDVVPVERLEQRTRHRSEKRGGVTELWRARCHRSLGFQLLKIPYNLG